MDNITLSFSNLTNAQAMALLNAGSAAGAPAPAAAAAAPPPPPPPPPPAAAAAPPPPPPPPPPAATGGTDDLKKQTAAAMSVYVKTHKTAGVKHVLAKCGLTSLDAATPEQLAWIKATFDSNTLPA